MLLLLEILKFLKALIVFLFIEFLYFYQLSVKSYRVQLLVKKLSPINISQFATTKG